MSIAVPELANRKLPLLESLFAKLIKSGTKVLGITTFWASCTDIVALARKVCVRLSVTVSVCVTPVVARYSTSKTNWSWSTKRRGPAITKSPAALKVTVAASAPESVKVGLTGAPGSAATCVHRLVKSSISITIWLPGSNTSSASNVTAPVVFIGVGGAEDITVILSIYRLAPAAMPKVSSKVPATNTYL